MGILAIMGDGNIYVIIDLDLSKVKQFATNF